MSKCKRWAAALLAVVMAVVLAIPAFADPTTYSLTIKSPTKGHNYQVYQVFAGTLAEDPNTQEETLVNITWGTGVKGDELLAALQSAAFTDPKAPTKTNMPFKTVTTAQGVADILVQWTNNAVQLDEFAEVVDDHLTTTFAEPEGGNVEVGDQSPFTTTIHNLAAGYYMVKEDTLDPGTETGNTYTKFILQLLSNKTIQTKAEEAPSIDKAIVEDGGTTTDLNTASVGEDVKFRLTSAVPAMDGYDKYFFIVHDTLSGGLTYKEINSIKIDNDTLEPNTDYTVTTDPASPAEGTPTKLKIVFNNFIQYKTSEYIGKTITIEYTATVNQKAEMGNDANTNTAKIQYSNDPNYNYQGTNEPNTGEPTGETPSSETKTFVGVIQIRKVDSQGKALTGAGFTLSGTGVRNVLVTTNDFTEDADGEYYKLKNGTYTKEAPDGENNGQYVSTTQKYSLTQTQTWKGEPTSATSVAGEVGEDGYVYFGGLGAGTYTIQETKVPDNYNKIGDITVTLTYTPGEEPEEPGAWSAKYKIGDGALMDATADEDGTIWFQVENRSGAVLPSTGGMGTTLFVGGGLVLMLLAIGLLIARKRAVRDEEKYDENK